VKTILRVDIGRDRCAPAAARRAIESLKGTVESSMVPEARLLVSELITNSVKYGNGGPVTLEVASERPDKMRVEVIDQGSGFVPAARTKPATEVGGWGLHLVGVLADRWGVHEGSTHVWFELSAGR
jgi:anti-sigma regulatory factor (Ser/Thr protein kinase)